MNSPLLAIACLLLLVFPIEANAEDKITKTPETIESYAVADGGRLLVMKLKGLGGLVLYDTTEQKISKIIKLPSEDFLFSAGGTTAVCYFPENNILQSWDLKSFARIKAKPNPMSGPITRIQMGHSRNDLAFCRYSEGTARHDFVKSFLLDTSSLQSAAPDFESRNATYRDEIATRANGDLGLVSEWNISLSPRGVSLLIRSGKKFETAYEHASEGYLFPGDDGKLYTGTGKIFSSGLKQIGELKGQFLFPGIGGSMTLGLNDQGKLTAYQAGSTTPIGPVGNFPDWPENTNFIHRQIGDENRDRLLVFNPLAGQIIFIPQTNDRIIQRSFDLKASLDKVGIDYLVVTSSPNGEVTPAKDWNYKVTAISSADEVNYSLELGPDGMTISKDGELKWAVPDDFKGSEKVIVLLSSKGGEETWHNFEVTAP